MIERCPDQSNVPMQPIGTRYQCSVCGDMFVTADPDSHRCLPVRFVNLTPHEIVLWGRPIPPSGMVARCAVEEHLLRYIIHPETEDGVPVYAVSFGAVEGLPVPIPGTYYLVSSIVAAAVRGRTDVVVPHHLVRDDAGRITGCLALGVSL